MKVSNVFDICCRFVYDYSQPLPRQDERNSGQ